MALGFFELKKEFRNKVYQHTNQIIHQMKKILTLVLFSTIMFQGLTQEIKGRSPEYYFNITKDPPKPPYLEIDEQSVVFTDINGNNAIDANETGTLKFTLKNTGMGEGTGLKLEVQETTGAVGLTFDKSKSLKNIKVNGSLNIQLPVSSNMNTTDGKAVFQISVTEPNGFDSDPIVVELATRAFVAPKLTIGDYVVQNSQGNRIQKKRPFDVLVLVQNIGKGVAEQVSLKLILPPDMYCLSGNEVEDLSAFKSGESKTITHNLVTTNDFNAQSIILKYELTEKYGKYGQTKTITLELNQEIASRDLKIQPVKSDPSSGEIIIATLSSAVDKDIPVSAIKFPNRFALIIGNENYTDYQSGLNSESNVAFARNDASVFRQYAGKVLGVEERNIFFITDATSGKMNLEISRMEEILKRAGKNAELIFYYAGHGFPDEVTQFSYLVPVDVSASNISSGIRMSDLYKRFSETGAARITIFLDACFSGGGRNSGLLAARMVKIKPKADNLSGNMVVFTASSGEQSALPNVSVKHGMFTYFLLKKMQETKGNISYSELLKYLKRRFPWKPSVREKYMTLTSSSAPM